MNTLNKTLFITFNSSDIHFSYKNTKSTRKFQLAPKSISEHQPPQFPQIHPKCPSLQFFFNHRQNDQPKPEKILQNLNFPPNHISEQNQQKKLHSSSPTKIQKKTSTPPNQNKNQDKNIRISRQTQQQAGNTVSSYITSSCVRPWLSIWRAQQGGGLSGKYAGSHTRTHSHTQRRITHSQSQTPHIRTHAHAADQQAPRHHPLEQA